MLDIERGVEYCCLFANGEKLRAALHVTQFSFSSVSPFMHLDKLLVLELI